MTFSTPLYSGSLTLANGNSWAITAEDYYCASVADKLAKTMQLSPVKKNGQSCMIIKNTAPAGEKPHLWHSAIKFHESTDLLETEIYLPGPAKDNNTLALQLMQLSLIICSKAESNGGLLIHGALAERDGAGVILAGPGGVGKSTASRRLPPPWQSLSDDCALIVRDKKGLYRAHPWPTWSTFMFGGTGGSWDVQHSVPLKAVFTLAQSEADQVEPLGKGQAVCLLNESAEQAWWMLAHDLVDEQKRLFLNLQRFTNICDLVKTIPAHLLYLSKRGRFWENIEEVLCRPV